MTVTPTLDVEGNPEMEICCNMGDVVEETAEEPTYYYEVTLEPKPVLRSYIAAAYDLCNELTDSELEQMGHDRKRAAFVCCMRWKRWMHWPITAKRRRRKSSEIIWMRIFPM